jgi:hypothetical protein
VRLSAGAEQLVVAEGLESALSLLCGYLAVPATYRLRFRPRVCADCLPARPGRLTIARDGDGPGRDAALALAKRESSIARACACSRALGAQGLATTGTSLNRDGMTS